MPVDPQFALDYHGNTFSIDGIRIETEDGVNGGLFGNAVTARNVMIDGCYVGGLIGALDGEMTVGQCFVAAGINDSGQFRRVFRRNGRFDRMCHRKQETGISGLLLCGKY